MTSSAPSPDPSGIVAAEPQLFAADAMAACDFYVSRLGFDVIFTHGDPVFYAQVARGGARLNFRLARHPVFDAGFLAETPDPLSATLTLQDAEPLFLEYQAAGVVFHQLLRTEPWGARTFVRDPDGNLILFAGLA